MIETLSGPYRIATRLDKRRAPDAEPYETLTATSWHEQDGTEITDTQRIAQLEAEHRPEQE